MLDLAGLERATIGNVRDAYKHSIEGGWKGKTQLAGMPHARMGDLLTVLVSSSTC